MSPMLFARLQADVDTKLRRGAWYRVLEVRDLEAVIEVNRKPVLVPKALLELQTRPPLRWTVVPKPARSRSGALQLGPTYAVCPSCRNRTQLPKRARRLECPRCKQEFEVNWAEGYLANS